jgi:protein SCO1
MTPKRKILQVLSAILASAALLTGCNRSEPPKETVSPSAAKRYTLTGRVVSVDKPNQSIVIDGNDIHGFMSAMQMPYPVKDASLLDKIAPGNQIKGEIVVAPDGAYLENIAVTAPATVPGNNVPQNGGQASPSSSTGSVPPPLPD